jgi:protein-S-isoprenylcysteine O-methyltransferase Ste14
MFLLPYGDRRGWLVHHGPDALRYLGLLLYAAGNALAFAAVKTLDKQYSGYVTLQDDHRLVQHGIYGVIRHPIYLRMLFVGVSVPLIFRSWLWVPFLLVIVGIVAYRIRAEEKLLAMQFGAEFEAYRRRTWRLIPFVY